MENDATSNLCADSEVVTVSALVLDDREHGGEQDGVVDGQFQFDVTEMSGTILEARPWTKARTSKDLKQVGHFWWKSLGPSAGS